MLKLPIKIYFTRGCLSATSNDIISSEWDHAALGLAKIHGNRLNHQLHSGWNEYSLEVLDAIARAF